jgi:saccharopine dehydrogenase (NAD+, L-lysine-forming)
MRIAILGGYGNAGSAIAQLLASHTGAELVLLGRDLDRAEEAAGELRASSGRQVSGVRADAASTESLRPVLETADLVVVASSTADQVRTVAEAAVNTATDYLDTNLSSQRKLATLRDLEPRIKNAARCFITDAGYHPGVPGALVRYAAERVPRLREAWVAGKFGLNWSGRSFSPETMAEFVAELREHDASVLRDGHWVRSWRTRSFDFGAPFGATRCVPMCMEEVRELPRQVPDLEGTGFYIAGFGFVFDYLIMPLCVAALTVRPKAVQRIGRVFHWGLNRFADKREACVLVLEAEGCPDSRPDRLRLRLSHADGYHLTAAPVVASIRQWEAGRRPPGVWTQGSFVEPVRFLDDLKSLGIEVSEELAA